MVLKHTRVIKFFYHYRRISKTRCSIVFSMADSKSLEKTRNIGHLNNFLGQKTRKLAIVPVSVNSDPQTRPTALTCQFIEKLFGQFILLILTPFQRWY